MNNIYVNTYNGSTYHESEDEMPDDLREDVGVIIPGLIESKEEYFEFVKKLKDRGRNGLGRSIYEKYEAMQVLRDKMAAVVWNIMEEHTRPQKRAELGSRPREKYMEVRKEVYNCQKWHRDVWEEEAIYYPGHGVTPPPQARMFVDHVKVTSKNAAIFADMLVRREEDKKYELKEYLRRNIKLT